ncbi:hypothetical protein PTTW11_08627 [Pyrenophora teres f. teres]|uniref:Uncharacterized protein n=1 Tax=Pyrenophora teres f. teres TaxID=97479 RepID=A0A6S6WEP1_9PLEO|nr:hypothetical protein PTTW11_08624 [Pyrenophora teres f. teres]CAE7200304.1 hypothetical protein PTTW11_08627 [Pyrenophora teres f. teres]
MKFFSAILVATLATLLGSATAKYTCKPCDRGGDTVIVCLTPDNIQSCLTGCNKRTNQACCDPGC